MELKHALTYQQQVERLRDVHKLDIPSETEAISILSRVNYYRLSAYGIGLKKTDNTEEFIDGISILTLYRLYCFDSKFRNILFHTTEHIEIQMRTQIANYLALKYGPECYINESLFEGTVNRDGIKIFDTILDDFKKECARQEKLPFVHHHIDKYDGHFPIWVAVEVFTFGKLSSLFSIMKVEDKKAISKIYKTRPSHLKSWLLSLIEIRNLCAHYSRIYNMPLKQCPFLFREYSKYQSNISNNQLKVFPAIITMKIMLEKVNSPQWNTTFAELTALFEEYSDVVKLSFIGFPTEWKDVLKPNDK